VSPSVSSSVSSIDSRIPIYTRQEAWAYLKRTEPKHASNLASELTQRVERIIQQVTESGNHAINQIQQELHEQPLRELTQSEIQAACDRIQSDSKRRETIEIAYQRIETFAHALKKSFGPVQIQHEGFEVGMTYRPVQRAGCYVPGGRFPLPSTALMTVTTACVAGVPEIILVSPKLVDEVIYAGQLAGATRFFQVGGAQAIAALAYGTETIPSVDVIVGPGNAYVTEAKRQLQHQVGIDMLAGPSEVGIIADAGANPKWVAADLVSQAEHDPDARAILMTDSNALAQSVQEEVTLLIQAQPALPDFLSASIQESAILVFESLEACADAANQLAPEHLQLNIGDPPSIRPLLLNYGALFVGYDATVPFGDYMAGPNHTLPTGRTARYTGGLTPLTFLRPQSWIQASASGCSLLAGQTASFAEMEGLTGHQYAAKLRMRSS
jgi:histidinol dehydrogenase